MAENLRCYDIISPHIQCRIRASQPKNKNVALVIPPGASKKGDAECKPVKTKQTSLAFLIGAHMILVSGGGGAA